MGCFYLTIDPLSLPPPDDAAIAEAAKHKRKRRGRYAAPLEPAPPPGFHQPMTIQPAAYGYPMPRIDLPEPAKPKDYLTFNIVVTTFCCLLLGVVGVCRSREARRALAEGRTDTARGASASALRWGVAALSVGLLVNIGLIILVVMRAYFTNEIIKED